MNTSRSKRKKNTRLVVIEHTIKNASKNAVCGVVACLGVVCLGVACAHEASGGAAGASTGPNTGPSTEQRGIAAADLLFAPTVPSTGQPTSQPTGQSTGQSSIALQMIDGMGSESGGYTERAEAWLTTQLGHPVVSPMSIQRELASCIEAPCPTQKQDLWTTATMTCTIAVGRVGTVYIASVALRANQADAYFQSVQDPQKKIDAVRANGKGSSADEAIQNAVTSLSMRFAK